jgi:hypothetical protein
VTVVVVVRRAVWVSPSPSSTVMVVSDTCAVSVWRAKARPHPIRCVADGLALGEATLDVVLGGAVLTHSDQHDGVERAVELSISRPVQSVPGDGPRGRLDGRGTAELGESGLGTDSSVMGPGGDELTGHDRADAQLAEQFGGEPTD